MPKGPTREWRRRKEPILDDEIRAAVQLGQHKIHEPGDHDIERNKYATLIHGGCKTMAEAEEIKRALFRSAKFLGFSVTTKIEKAPLGGFQVKFTPMCKDCARAWVLQTHGTDRSKWPYDPLRKRSNEDH